MEVPDDYVLGQNYPNPFNPSTTIRYELPEAVSVRVIVYDALGREIQHLVDGLKAVGKHEVIFEGAGLASGVYVYRLEAGAFSQMHPMVLMK